MVAERWSDSALTINAEGDVYTLSGTLYGLFDTADTSGETTATINWSGPIERVYGDNNF